MKCGPTSPISFLSVTKKSLHMIPVSSGNVTTFIRSSVEITDYVAGLKSDRVAISCEDPDNPVNFLPKFFL